MRFGIAALHHETNSFSNIPMDWKSMCKVRFEKETYRRIYTPIRNYSGGFLAKGKELGIEIVPTTGRFFLDSEDLTGRGQETINHKGIARTFQNIRLFNNMTVIRNVMVGLHDQPEYKCTVAESMFRLPRHFKAEKDMRERAKELLRIKRLSVTDIANSVGYDDALLFSRVFKSHAGVSPLEYRKCFLSNEQDSYTDI